MIDIAIGRDSRFDNVHRMCTAESIYCTEPISAKTSAFLLEHGIYNNEPASKILLMPLTGMLL